MPKSSHISSFGLSGRGYSLNILRSKALVCKLSHIRGNLLPQTGAGMSHNQHIQKLAIHASSIVSCSHGSIRASNHPLEVLSQSFLMSEAKALGNQNPDILQDCLPGPNFFQRFSKRLLSNCQRPCQADSRSWVQRLPDPPIGMEGPPCNVGDSSFPQCHHLTVNGPKQLGNWKVNERGRPLHMINLYACIVITILFTECSSLVFICSIFVLYFYETLIWYATGLAISLTATLFSLGLDDGLHSRQSMFEVQLHVLQMLRN